ncbi:MAG: type II toxin-antitoxin system PemK/MazF family toxin [Desulfosarcina sp.]|nr:type II toxin-antitoxin system PemK/MazF family toxin [Desulfobacterales bacterium]
MAIVCPLASTERGFPFHVPVPEKSSLTGFIMVEQVKSVDFRTRRGKRIERVSDEMLANVLSILDACIYEHNRIPS